MGTLAFYLPLFALGIAHGIEPGHGKLALTSYFAGTPAKLRDALALGVLVALFHTLSVALLSWVIVALASTLFKDTFLTSLEVISGLLIFSLGLFLFWQRFLRPQSEQNGCECHVHHCHAGDEDNPSQTAPRTTLKQVLLLAVASGITPCPVALAALIAAFAAGAFLPALTGLLIFSLGIGSVLIILGLGFVYGVNQLEFRWKHKLQLAPVIIARVSCIVVMLLGCYLVSKPFLFPESTAHANEAESINFLMRPQTAQHTP